jgi:hypothetical protein
MTGYGGNGGMAKYESVGADGGLGGDCVFKHGAKTGSVGIEVNHGNVSNAGNIVIEGY